jgi:hypothetical protein
VTRPRRRARPGAGPATLRRGAARAGPMYNSPRPGPQEGVPPCFWIPQKPPLAFRRGRLAPAAGRLAPAAGRAR